MSRVAAGGGERRLRLGALLLLFVAAFVAFAIVLAPPGALSRVAGAADASDARTARSPATSGDRALLGDGVGASRARDATVRLTDAGARVAARAPLSPDAARGYARDALELDDQEQRMAAVQALGEAGAGEAPVAVAALESVLAHGTDLRDRLVAIESLRRLGEQGDPSRRIREALIGAAADAHEVVADHARAAHDVVDRANPR